MAMGFLPETASSASVGSHESEELVDENACRTTGVGQEAPS